MKTLAYGRHRLAFSPCICHLLPQNPLRKLNVNRPYRDLLDIWLDFIETRVLPFSMQEDPASDLAYTKNFLAGKITHHELRTRATYAWKNYENSEGTEKNIRRITVHFLFPRTLEGNPLPGAIYEDFLMLLEQMFEIKEGLRTDFSSFPARENPTLAAKPQYGIKKRLRSVFQSAKPPASGLPPNLWKRQRPSEKLNRSKAIRLFRRPFNSTNPKTQAEAVA